MPSRFVDLPLRADVRLLGALLGDAVRKDSGKAAFELVERVRLLAVARRRGPARGRHQAGRLLGRTLGRLPVARAEPLIRAFAQFFQLVNVAEQHHRIRRARAHAGSPGGQPGSLAAVMRQARRAGASASAVRAALSRLELVLVFTAHPTQAVRRTVLEKLERVAHFLETRDWTVPTPHEVADREEELRAEVASLWQSDELRRERPGVGDEVKAITFYLESVLVGLGPELGHRCEEAFERTWGKRLGATPAPLRLRSWAGGDMDGNPLVTPEVLLDAARAYHERGLRLLSDSVRELGRRLSQSERHVKVPEELLEAVRDDERRFPLLAQKEGPRTEGEPFRRKLRFLDARLRASLDEVTRRRSQANAASEGMAIGADEGEASLELVARALEEAGGPAAQVRSARALADRIRSVGTQVAGLELRAPAPDALAAAAGEHTAGADRLLGALRAVRQAQAEGGEESCSTAILSMTTSAAEPLALLRCMKAVGLWDERRGCGSLDVVPLFETLEALQQSPAIVGDLLSDPGYASHVRGRGAQEVMLGYSDSGKQVGLLAAAWALRRAQQQLLGKAREKGVPLRFFHGRGESVARGGGPAQGAILALPDGSVGDCFKVTEQGEALDHKYSRPEIALRTLELYLGGALLHTLGLQPKPAPDDEARFEEAFAGLADEGRRAFRSLVWEEPQFEPFFEAATPVREISELKIGSRPAKRASGGLESLRAIPWVFAWTQNRVILPGWYGVGSALEAALRVSGGKALLRSMHRRWPFFRTLLDAVEMTLAKTDMEIGARYVELAPARAREAVWPRIEAEHARTLRTVLEVTGGRRILDGNRPLQRSIALRNPYVDPLSYLQVDLLRRSRAGEPGCERALLLTVAGIAGGLRNTG